MKFRYILLALIVVAALTGPASAAMDGTPTPTATHTPFLGNCSRAMAVETIATPDGPPLYLSFLSIIGGDQQMTENDTASDFFNIEALPGTALSVYTSQMGGLAVVIIFSLPFFMLWIIGRGIEIPTIIGIVIGVFAITRLPGEYQLPAVAGIALGVTAILYTMLKERL